MTKPNTNPPCSHPGCKRRLQKNGFLVDGVTQRYRCPDGHKQPTGKHGGHRHGKKGGTAAERQKAYRARVAKAKEAEKKKSEGDT